MKVFTFLSSAAFLTFSLTPATQAQLYLPNVGECFAGAQTPNDHHYCKALQRCMEEESDDNASLRGCVDQAQDFFASANMGIVASESPGNPVFGLPSPFSEFVPTGTEESNSDLVWGIQGQKGYTNQQEGPND